VRFEAVALDVQPIQAIGKDFVAGFRVDGTSIVIDFGPATINFRSSDLDANHLALDFIAPAPAPLPPPPPPPTPTPTPTPVTPAPTTPAPARPAPQEPARPAIETSPGTLRTVVLDPGHGGEDLGVTGPGGTIEKDVVLQFARRLKSAIESRIGVRVILTRDGDIAVPLDRRASIANNNKADLLISLHANGSVRPTLTGAQVLSLRLDDYSARAPTIAQPDLPVAFLTGGPRTIEILPWDLAQIGFTRPSSVVAALLERQLERAGVPLFPRRGGQLPLRPLVGASMPAVFVELGFLSNPDEETALTTGDRQQRTIEAILDTLGEIRRGVPDQAPEAAAR
jgi:N-acetylmuramoyl-L-alanine amidase